MKRILALILACVMLFALGACGRKDDAQNDKIKVGIILIGDEQEGYSKAHIDGLKAAAKTLGLDESTQLIFKYNVHENESCYDAAMELVEAGCNLVISNSYNHQTYTQQAAAEAPEVQFVAMTGDTAAKAGLANFSNAFTRIYEARYLSGVVAGKKIEELIASGKLGSENYDENGNVKIGYVGALPFAEVISGYTAFYLGAKSVVKNVSMDVTFTGSWSDYDQEKEAANSLIARGCVIIGQHADTTGAPQATEEQLAAGKVCYSVGYNIDMLTVAPNAALTSATNNWASFYEYAIKTVMAGEKLVTDWSEGYSTDAVAITALGNSCAAGTQEAVNEAIEGIKNGSVKVFDASAFTVEGKNITTCEIEELGEAVSDGYFHESELRSAPYFNINIDGITKLNNN